MKQDYAKKDKELTTMATLRDQTLPDNLLESFKDTVCTPEKDETVARELISFWTKQPTQTGRTD